MMAGTRCLAGLCGDSSDSVPEDWSVSIGCCSDPDSGSNRFCEVIGDWVVFPRLHGVRLLRVSRTTVSKALSSSAPEVCGEEDFSSTGRLPSLAFVGAGAAVAVSASEGGGLADFELFDFTGGRALFLSADFLYLGVGRKFTKDADDDAPRSISLLICALRALVPYDDVEVGVTSLLVIWWNLLLIGAESELFSTISSREHLENGFLFFFTEVNT